MWLDLCGEIWYEVFETFTVHSDTIIDVEVSKNKCLLESVSPVDKVLGECF